MGIFSFLFGGKYPQTKKYEAGIAKHKADYQKFLEIEKSTELARFYELEKITADKDFQNRVYKLKNDKFKDTQAYIKYREWVKMQKSSDIIDYYKFKKQGKDTHLSAALASSVYSEFLILDQQVNTPDFQQKKQEKGFKKTEDYKTYRHYKQLRRSSEKRFIDKTVNSAAYNNFRAVDGSERLKKYEELTEYVNSEQFIMLRRDLEDPKRYQKSDEYKTVCEFEALQKNKTLLWYFEQKKNDAFSDITSWKETFCEDFNAPTLNEKTWTVGYFWGKQLVGSVYSLEDERQMFKKENANVAESVLSIVTKREEANGKCWSPKSGIGFINKDFEFTSSLVNTGASFRQLYGRFDFKVKASFNAPLTHNIWMVGETQSPQINVAVFGLKKKTFTVGVATEKTSKSFVVDGANFASDFYVISLIWTKQKLTWLVNGVEVYVQTTDVPQVPMYIVLSSNITAESKISGGKMDIDWIKCYEKTK